LRNKEIKQISLLESANVSVAKRLIVDASQSLGQYFPSEGAVGVGDIKPQVRVEFVNDEANGLAIPLPQGRVRVFQRDASGSVHLLGEDRIKHTPRNERLSLAVGRSFDIVATRLRTNFTRLDNQATQESFEIELRNRKETEEIVELIERPYGSWRVTEADAEFEKTSANSIVFKVCLEPNEVRTVRYTVETRW
jgi:hypothetical protein